MIPNGYKQTEVGVIPADWRCAKIEDIATISMCKRIFADQTTEKGEIPFYKIGTFGKEADAYISRTLYNEYRHRFSFPQKGDVLISAAGTLGRTVIYDGKDAYFQDSNIVWLDIDKNALCNEYLNHYYRIIKWASSEGSTIARLYNGIIYATNIALPPLKEQNRIAEALSDVDSMISSLEKLIAKKKAVKQGAMQELLTGKKRLPGFTGEWKKYKLGDICCISGRIGFRGYTKNDLVNKGFGAITFSPSDIFEQKLDYSNCDYISFFKYDESPEIQVFNGDIIFCKTASIGKTALVKNLTEKATINPQFVLMNKFKCNNEFLYYIISGKEFVEQILSITGGSTIPTISQEQLKMQWICMPELDEQNAIASILSDMDNEIEALEQKLAKARQIKRGMMQQLLTGKIRLL